MSYISETHLPSVAVFTDTYFPTVNGVTYTIDAWREHWSQAMSVVYPQSPHTPRSDEHPVPSLPFPFYEGYRVGWPGFPRTSRITDVDVVHAHTGFALGLAGLRYARQIDCPFVSSYHTPVREYVDYITSIPGVSTILENGVEAYERWFYNQSEAVIVPSQATRNHLEDVGVDTPIEVISNGIDTTMFEPTDRNAFCEKYNISTEKPIIGYTGRHGIEKNLGAILDAIVHMDREVTLLFGGDGPARSELEAQANNIEMSGIDVQFLGFIDREDLPGFYSTLDAFVFPSPVETEGIVAKEAIACGTPVIGADSGALPLTIEEGVTGYISNPSEPKTFAKSICRTLDNQEALVENCLEARDGFGVSSTLDKVESLYRRVIDG